MRKILFLLGFSIMFLGNNVEAADSTSKGCKDFYKSMSKGMKMGIIGQLLRAKINDQDIKIVDDTKLVARKIDKCNSVLEFYASLDAHDPVCTEEINECTDTPATGTTATGTPAQRIKKEQLNGASDNSMKEFKGDYPGETFQQNKEKRVRGITSNGGFKDKEPPGEFQVYLVGLNQGADENMVLSSIEKEGGIVVEKNIPYLEGVIKIKIQKAIKDKVIEKLKQNQSIRYIDPMFPAKVDGQPVTPNDPEYQSQWGLSKIGMPTAWSISQGGGDVIVAVLDTGVVPHTDLKDNLVQGYNFVNNSYDTNDYKDLYHGTAVAGAIAAVGNNGTDIAGMAWHTRIMPIVVCDGAPGTTATCNRDLVAKGINWAVQHGAKVINMSFGDDTYTTSEMDAVNNAWVKGVVLIASAGNIVTTQAHYPSSFNNVISVGATTSTDGTWRDSPTVGSSYGPSVDVAAPGEHQTCLNGADGIGWGSGTSLSAPLVSGLAALLIATDPSLSNTAIVNIIQNTSVAVPLTPEHSVVSVSGRVNAAAALQAALPGAKKDGDLTGNGIVTISDALISLRTVVGIEPATDSIVRHGDIAPYSYTGFTDLWGNQYVQFNGNGAIDLADTLATLYLVIGLIIH